MGDININLNPKVPALPKFEDKTKIDVRYMVIAPYVSCLLYTSPSPRDRTRSRMPSSA